jgi:hypothetical protein
MSVIPSDPAIVQLLNCAKGHATTISAHHSFASNPNCLIILLQEPAIEYTKLPPSYPNFHLLTPVPENPFVQHTSTAYLAYKQILPSATPTLSLAPLSYSPIALH